MDKKQAEQLASLPGFVWNWERLFYRNEIVWPHAYPENVPDWLKDAKLHAALVAVCEGVGLRLHHEFAVVWQAEGSHAKWYWRVATQTGSLIAHAATPLAAVLSALPEITKRYEDAEPN